MAQMMMVQLQQQQLTLCAQHTGVAAIHCPIPCPSAAHSSKPKQKPHLTPGCSSNSFGAFFEVSCNNYKTRSRRLVAVSLFKSPPKEEGSFFDSNVVQTELHRIQSDYKRLVHLGKNYPQFDREGKLSYIREMKDVLERWQIFHKRMELSDDFSAKLYAKHLKTKVKMFTNATSSLGFSLSSLI
ncbi:hypothetical protein O6H91_07G065500 [Diphasiastrum complanatum]|uniref:Uncharacterized protein n=1 Tax=Diphasiastrum complanatum TaxID=34168 RepID=A0ACC2D610_DIPCM|nr:hypothetical protein O6H91_07G065500 [Diphasiastrum complanatum]